MGNRMINKRLLESELVAPFVQDHEYVPSEYTRRDIDPRTPKGADSWLDDWHDPHEVGLKNYDQSKWDGKTLYYTELSDLMGTNPYMPIVYNIDSFGDKSKPRMEFRLERLIPTRSVDVVRLSIAIKRVLLDLRYDSDSPMIQDLEYVQEAELGNYKEERNIVLNVHIQMMKRLRAELENPSRSVGQLREFADRFHAMFKRATDADIPIFFDLHGENIMYRRVQHGVQLVVTDPISTY